MTLHFLCPLCTRLPSLSFSPLPAFTTDRSECIWQRINQITVITISSHHGTIAWHDFWKWQMVIAYHPAINRNIENDLIASAGKCASVRLSPLYQAQYMDRVWKKLRVYSFWSSLLFWWFIWLINHRIQSESAPAAASGGNFHRQSCVHTGGQSLPFL